jgi:hypothetical protein
MQIRNVGCWALADEHGHDPFSVELACGFAGLGYRWGTLCNVLGKNGENHHDVVGCDGQVLRHIAEG